MLSAWEFPAWDPVILELFGPIHLRWYGLMYIVAFVSAHFLMTRLAKAGFWRANADTIGDLIFYTVLGTMLGGRIGYALIYAEGSIFSTKIFRVWEGGLSFHGGLIGVTIAFVLFARKHGLSIWRVGDVCALCVPPGIFAVRMANFINGELYGRTTDASTFGAMQFPTDEIALQQMGLFSPGVGARGRELGIQYAYGDADWADVAPELGERAEQIKPLLSWDAVREFVPHRHPSQLYEGFGEGLLIGVVLWSIWWRFGRGRAMAPGRFCGIFLIGYGVVRFCIEFLRQPDSQFRDEDDKVGTVLLGMTMGQVLCALMMFAGAVLLLRRASMEPPEPEPATVPPSGEDQAP